MLMADKLLLLLLVAASATEVFTSRSSGETDLNNHKLDVHGVKKAPEMLEKKDPWVKNEVDDIGKIKECLKFMNWIKFTGFSAQGKIFHFNETKVNHYQANEYCQQRGLQLATLKAVADVETVATKLKNLNAIANFYWVSASDIGNTPGQFQWADGTSVIPTVWSSGFPRQFRPEKETCAYLDLGDNKLKDATCPLILTFILCEVPPTFNPCF